jgi:2-phosphosulfolactate phosphatase
MNITLVMTADSSYGLVTDSMNAVVIDVLRATSVMVTALNNGCEKIAAFKTIEETIAYKNANPTEDILLCGERNRVKIDGFDLGNSPVLYTKERVMGKTIAMTTTNGTRAVENAKPARNLYIMSFLNTVAVCKKLSQDNRDTVIVCSGTEGKFTIDDFICAGKAIDILSSLTDLRLDDSSFVALEYFIQGGKNVPEMVKKSSSYHQVINKGFLLDAEFCVQQDIFDIAPVYRDGFIRR